jgi:SAM-dependent methyltransferase
MITDSERRWTDSMPEAYQRWLAPIVFEPFADDLARRAAALDPRLIIELAAGTGVVTRCLRDAMPGADIVATDLNEAMVAFGRSGVPEASWRQADALDLPFDDEVADAVVCQFGVMFFPDKRAAYVEIRRVLKPAGNLLLNSWDVVATHDFAAALVAALEQVFPHDAPTFVCGVPHGYSAADVIREDIRSAGFSDIRLDTITLTSPPAVAADVASGFCLGTPLRAEIQRRADLMSTTKRIAGLVQEKMGAGPVTGRMTAHVVQARSR